MSRLAKSTDTKSQIREGLIDDLIALEECFGENTFLAEIEECLDVNVLRILAKAIAIQQSKFTISLKIVA